MKYRRTVRRLCRGLFPGLFLSILAGLAPGGVLTVLADIAAPQLKWQNAGCYSSWCEKGWYSSPAVADLDGDGRPEVIASAYSVVALDGATGDLLWRVKSGHDRADSDGAGHVGRTWPGVVVADVDNDGELEIVTAHGGGWVSVYDADGYFDNGGWPWRNPSGGEFRSLAVADLDGNGDLEIIVGRAELNKANVWVLEHTGKVRKGWPRLAGGQGSAAGLYNDNIGIGDLDGDGLPEVIVPSDTITICAYRADGSQLGTHAMYHGHPGHDMDHWGEVSAYVDLDYETRGWGPCYDQYTLRANFANGPANVADVDGDGVNEVVAVGDVHDCHTSPYTDHYNGPYIFNADRSRFNGGGFDWQTVPQNTGEPLIQDYGVIESCQPNTVTADLDGDGRLEILYPSYDGRLHAFWLDQTEHHSWPFAVHHSGDTVYRFASEPAVADLDGDGYAEVVFTTWVQKRSGLTGGLYILSYRGEVLRSVDLPPAYDSSDWNGALPAPTLADIDGDPDLEVVVNTAHAGLVAYDLPGTANARILWGTGRGSYLRDGRPAQPAPIVIGPDLKVTWDRLAITAPDSNGLYGLKGKVVVTNTGNRPSKPCSLGITYPAGGPTILAKARKIKALKPSRCIKVGFKARRVALRTDAASTLAAVVDIDDRVAETDEGNNTADRRIQGVDLRGQWLQTRVRGPKRGRYTVQGKYGISSDVPAGAFLVQVYLSSDDILDGADTPLLKKPRKVKKLPGGKTVRGGFKAKVDQDPAGRYLILALDTENSVAESDEDNNRAARQLP